MLERYIKHFDDTTGEQRKAGISIELSYLLEAAHRAICITRVKAQASTFSDKLMVLLKSRTKGELDQDNISWWLERQVGVRLCSVEKEHNKLCAIKLYLEQKWHLVDSGWFI